MPQLKPTVIFLPILLALSLSACDTTYELKTAAKSDIDLVADTQLEKMNELLQGLMIQLYEQNPRELDKIFGESIQSRLDQVFSHPGPVQFEELKRLPAADTIALTFDPDYPGDRVFAYIAGLTDMIHHAYGYQHEFFVMDELSEQSLYNSARNLELLARRLKNNELLHSGNSKTAQIFGEMIGTQDLMARIISDKSSRTINKVVHGIASVTLLPIGL